MRFRKIDASNLEDHARLYGSDTCFFLHEYTSGQGYGFGEANNLISNLKKSVDRKTRAEYSYKNQSIRQCSSLLRSAINSKWLDVGTIVPVPPSKDKTHLLYDDRLFQVCRGIDQNKILDVREIVKQSDSIRAAHESPQNRPALSELEAIYFIDESLCLPQPRSIAVVDDVLTAGTHFRAMHNILSRRFPNVPVVGMFIARRVFPASGDVDDDPF